MKKLILAAIRCSLIFTGVAALSLAYPASVQAVPTTYRYTGNHFTEVSGPYTTSMFVTAMVTLAAPLEPNMCCDFVTPTAFTLFDGVQTISNTTPGFDFQLFFFETNARGEITFWSAVVSTVSGQGIETIHDGLRDIDSGGTPEFGGSTLFGSPGGQWTQVTATPDAGSTLSLMTLTLMALGVAARQFKRAAV